MARMKKVDCAMCYGTGYVFGDETEKTLDLCVMCGGKGKRMVQSLPKRKEIDVPMMCLSPTATMPTYSHEDDSGFDFYADEEMIVEPGETKRIKTGIAVSLPPGYEIQARPRSGVSFKTTLRIANAPGTIDRGFIGEIEIIVDNIAAKIGDYDTVAMTPKGEFEDVSRMVDVGALVIRKGDRIAQGVLAEVPKAVFREVTRFEETGRGAEGFGSTGV